MTTVRGVDTLFVYWGRRGPLGLLTLQLADVLERRPDLRAAISYSAQNELAMQLGAKAPIAAPFPTFNRGIGALLCLPAFLLRLRGAVAGWRAQGVRTIVILMPHVWTPFLSSAARQAGIATIVLVHDAARHPGDRTAAVQGWLLSDLGRVNRVVTLSRVVTEQLVAHRPILATRTVTLFHPWLGSKIASSGLSRSGTLRVLWFGRIMRYKGLPLLVEAAKLLASQNVPVDLTVAGEGDLSAELPGLKQLGARTINHWLSNDEIAALLAECDVVALPYVEASQSGVIAAALGAGRPVVATPVGGLVEQIDSGVNGLICARVDASAFAETLGGLARDRRLLARLHEGAARPAAEHGIEAFAVALMDLTREAAERNGNL